MRLGRSEPATLLIVDGRAILLDAGVGSLQQLNRAGFHAQDIDAVLITHHHLDHDGGLSDLIAYSVFGKRVQPVEIVGPLGTIEMVKAALGLVAPTRRTLMAERLLTSPDPTIVYLPTDIPQLADPGVIYRSPTTTVTAAENTHFALMPATEPAKAHDRSYGFRVTTPAGVVAFTGDSGPSPALARLARGADILVSEVIDVATTMKSIPVELLPDEAARERMRAHMQQEHLTPEAVGKLATEAGVKMVVLTHFSPGADGDTNTQGIVSAVKRYFSGIVIAGRDLDEYDLPL